MTTAKKFPKFRKTSRLIKWIEKNSFSYEYYSQHGRPFPEEIERIFFKTSEGPEQVVCTLVNYSDYWNNNRLPENLEELLIKKVESFCVDTQSDDSVVHDAMDAYFNYCNKMYLQNTDPSERMLNVFKGWSSFLLRWALETEKRLPQNLEDSMSDPTYLLKYSVDVLKGRLPEHLENLFYKNVHAATEYAFEVIRGFAPVKLPEHLHNFVVMKSFEHPNDRIIKAYMMASESDPNKNNNYAAEL